MILLILAIALIASGLLVLIAGSREAETEHFFERARAHAQQKAGGQSPPIDRGRGRHPWAYEWLVRVRASARRAGVRILVGLAAAFVLTAGAAWIGAWRVALGILAASLLVSLVMWRRGVQRHQQIVRQVPGLLDTLMRGLEVGKTVETAFTTAVDSSRPPLRPILTRVQRRVRLGDALGDAFRHAGEANGVRELHLLGFILSLHQSHGGRASDMLEGLSRAIVVEQQMARDLRALTAETRFTALILILLPVVMGGYLLAVNPNYLLTMWEHEDGRYVLLLAGLLQAIGSILIWRLSAPRRAT